VYKRGQKLRDGSSVPEGSNALGTLHPRKASYKGPIIQRCIIQGRKVQELNIMIPIEIQLYNGT
jgi:hypothetical protein